MQDIDVLRLERLDRVKTFLENHIGEFATGSVVDQTRIEVTGLLTTLNAARVTQIRLLANKEEIVASLIARFKDIARTARSILSDDPSFPEEVFRFAGDYSENSAATHADAIFTLLDAKHGDTVPNLARKAALRERFTEYEMDPGFVSALRADRDSLADAYTRTHADNEDDLDTAAAVATLFHQANNAVTRLNGPIQNKYSADPDKIHEWNQASHMESGPAPPEPEPTTA